MRRTKHQNIERVVAVASQLEELVQEVVFVGGAAAGLLVTDPAVGDIRSTIDVDVIVEVTTLAKYYNFQERLRSKGFRESMEDGVICRWRSKEILLDVMPTDQQILGFSNRWYIDAVRHAQFISVEGVALRMVTAPYFLGTKLEAFYGRGKGDYMSSRDIEDLIVLLDGRPEIVEDVKGAEKAIKQYLGENFKELLADEEFLDALAGHLPPDEASQKRVSIIEERMKQIANLGSQ